MSVREKDRQKNCPSRGLGIAAAAIGVGVGAALYYLFSKREETPHGEGSTSDWNERPQTFRQLPSEDSYSTMSEHETTDTSINDNSGFFNDSTDSIDSVSDYTTDSYYDSETESTSSEIELSVNNLVTEDSDSDGILEWDVTTSSLGVPDESPRSPLVTILNNLSNRFSQGRRQMSEEDQMNIIRQQAFRERSWTLEECSICFEVMLRSQDVTSLSCTHNFHTDCIMPWLQERQTCPNCRKAAE